MPGGEVAIQVERLYSAAPSHAKQIERFRIARYPITVAQYRAFLEAEDGWRDPAWWAGDLYRDPEGDSYDFGRFGNHPAVYVSWFDAMAFCRWLSRRLGATVGLPDEWQWQQAATGGDASNLSVGRRLGPETEPTGRTPSRAASAGPPRSACTRPAPPADALDMAGTVWEWCLNKYDRPEMTESRDDDFDPRVVRGGSWDRDRDLARCAYRVRRDPDYRYGCLGFRVVSSSPI